jgi:hypothetical protein
MVSCVAVPFARVWVRRPTWSGCSIYNISVSRSGCGFIALYGVAGGDRGGDGNLPARGPGQETAWRDLSPERDIYDATLRWEV